MPDERLQKVLAHAGVASRRAAEELIRQGRVRVDGRVVTDLGTKVGEDAAITVDGRSLSRAEQRLVYLLLNKPAGYVTTVADPQGRPTVLDLVPRQGGEWAGMRLYPVGRLDLASEGLLLLTNDGALALQLTHPRYHEEREYLVQVQGHPSAAELQPLRQGGLPVDGRPLAPAEVGPSAPPPGAKGDPATTWLRLILHEGRKRQVRRMCEAIGYPVVRLIRVRLGPLRLGNLPTGALRSLSAEEVSLLKQNDSITGGGS